MSEALVQRRTLANGLEIIGESSKNSHSAAIGFFVKTGSRDETAKEAGVSHFLEHMMFKGTAKRTSLQITYDMGNIGAQANAFTSEENTVYYAQIIPEYFSQMQEILSDMLRPSIDPEEFSVEKKVILEEIALYQDRPSFYLFEHAMSDYFGAHPAGQSVLGSTESISALSRDEMYNYFSRRYSPSNMVLVASGNFDWGKFVDDAERLCSGWQDIPVSRKVSGFKGSGGRKIFTKKNLIQPQILFLADGPSAQDEDRYPMGLLSMILGDAAGSRIYWDLVVPGLVDSAGADLDERDGVGLVSAYAGVSPENLDKVSDILRGIITAPKGFTEAELSRAKTKLASRVALRGELPMGRLMSLGMEWNYRKKIHSLDESIRRIKAVTLADLESALTRWPLDRWMEYRLSPSEKN